MHAVIIARPGGPEVLELRDVARPDPGVHQVRVRVHATAVNRADLMQRQGRYPAPADVPQDIPGLEYAGVVDDVGDGVTLWQPGDRVMGLVGGGSYAEYLVTHEAETVRIPDAMSFTDAAAVPEAFITAHDALLTQMKLAAHETVLVHAVGSGVGTAALQIAKAVGARVIGTQRTQWKLERALELGLDVAIDSSDGDFVDEVMRHTDGRGVDAVLDLVGGDVLGQSLRCLATRGRILLVGLVAGARHELDLRLMLNRRATITGTVLRARSHDEKADATSAFVRDVLPALESGAVRPIVDCVMPLAEAGRAHERVAANENFGKVVLEV